MTVRDGSLGVLLFLLVVFVSAIFLQERAKKTGEYSTGMTIRTADVNDSVEARAFSLGPDACDVVIRTSDGDSASLLAPPDGWSAWAVVASHAGSKTYNITRDAQCESGVRTELRWVDARR